MDTYNATTGIGHMQLQQTTRLLQE